MTTSACLRAFALASVALIGLGGLHGGAQQSNPTTPAQPPAGQNPPVQPPAVQPPAVPPVSQSGMPNAPSGPQTVPQGIPNLGRSQETPAEQRYGIARAPIVTGPVSTDLTQPLTLDRAILIALQNQNAIAIARAQADIANASLVQARSTYLPQIAPSFQYQNALGPGVSSRTGLPLHNEGYTDLILAQQLIYDTGKREANVGQALRNVYASEYGLGDERQTVIFTVTGDYYTLMEDLELVRVEQENVAYAQTSLNAVNAQIAVGKEAAVDRLQSESQLANAQVALLQAQNNSYLAQAALKNAMGIVSSQPLILAQSTLAAPSLTSDTTPLETYVGRAYSDRLDVKEQLERVYAQGYSVRIAHINNGVTVDATVSEGYEFNPSAGENRVFTVTFGYPLFDAGATRAAVRASEAALEQEQRTLDALEQTVRQDVEQAYATREQARKQISAAQAAVTAGQANYQAALGKQQFGTGTVLDVLNAEVQLVTAQVSLVQAIYQYYDADASLQRAIGANDPAFVPNVPPGHTAFTSYRTPPGPQPVPSGPPVKPRPGGVVPPQSPNTGKGVGR
ncbi:MAG TPA: TolC family protein [Chthonomonadaceae bacterium]|nr:TolC family protein [Chthonomonadaceae bacterium]